MLVLTRRPGESIVIDGNVRISVLEARGDRIRLGIEAPPNVVVDRKEVHERRQQFARRSDASPCLVAHPSTNGVTARCNSR